MFIVLNVIQSLMCYLYWKNLCLILYSTMEF